MEHEGSSQPLTKVNLESLSWARSIHSIAQVEPNYESHSEATS